MKPFDRVFSIACACCKADGADVPEVQAVITLLLPWLRELWSNLTHSLSGEAVRLLQLLGRQENRPSDIALLLAAYVAGLKTLAEDPLTGAAANRVEDAVEALSREAARLAGLPVPARLGLIQSIRAAQVSLMLQQQAERAIMATLPAATRILQDSAGLEGSEESIPAARRELERAMDPQQAILAVLDSWAYQTFNAASIRAAADAGENFIQLRAKQDKKTTAFCRMVDGRVVPMARALDQLRRIDEAVLAGSIEDLLIAAPFHPHPETATEADVTAAIERGGLAPFHHRCRTQNVPVRLSTAALT